MEARRGEDGVRLARSSPPALSSWTSSFRASAGSTRSARLRADERTRAIPVMAVTASVMAQDRQKIMDAGFDAYQPKPISVREFLAAVEALGLGRRDGAMSTARPSSEPPLEVLE